MKRIMNGTWNSHVNSINDVINLPLVFYAMCNNSILFKIQKSSLVWILPFLLERIE